MKTGVKTSYKNKKKRQSTNTIQFLDCKKTKRRPIIAPAIAVRLLKKELLIVLLANKNIQNLRSAGNSYTVLENHILYLSVKYFQKFFVSTSIILKRTLAILKKAFDLLIKLRSDTKQKTNMEFEHKIFSF